jgi:hypothetical protein
VGTNPQQGADVEPTLRKELIAELRLARQQTEPPRSALRDEIIAELRAARQQSEPQVTRSAVRDEIISELRSAREQAEPKVARSALRDEIVAELRSARLDTVTSVRLDLDRPRKQPSALRKEIIEELRAARELSDKEEMASKIEVPAPVQEVQELPWEDTESLLTENVEAAQAEAIASASDSTAASSMAEHILAFNRLLRTLVLSGTALGLASAAKLPELDLKVQGRSPAQQVTLVLFFVPLIAMSADYLFDLAVGNEFALIAGSWGLAAMACIHQRNKQ